MNLESFFINYRIYIELFYFLFVILSCLFIYFRAKKIYDLSLYEGIKYFKDSFLFFAIGFFLTWVINASLILNRFTFIYYLKIFQEYFLLLGGFYLIYSLLWKNFKESYIFELRIILIHGIAIIISIIDFFNGSYFMMFIVEIIIALYGIYLSYQNYINKKESKFLQFYFIAMVLNLIAWIINFIRDFFSYDYPVIQIYGYLATAIIFLIFLFGLIKLTNKL